MSRCRCRLAVACFDVCIEQHRDALTAISNDETYDFVSRLQLGGCLKGPALRELHLAALAAQKCDCKHTQADGSDLPCCFKAVSFQVGDKAMVHACTPVYLLAAFPCWRVDHEGSLAALNATPALLKTGKFKLCVKQMSCSCIFIATQRRISRQRLTRANSRLVGIASITTRSHLGTRQHC